MQGEEPPPHPSAPRAPAPRPSSPAWAGGRMLQMLSPPKKNSILQPVFVGSRGCRCIPGSSSPNRGDGAGHPGLAVEGGQDRSLHSPLPARGSVLQSPTRDHPPKKPPPTLCHPERSLGVPKLCGVPRHCHPIPTHGHPAGSCRHPLSPRVPQAGTAVAAGDAGSTVRVAGDSCLPRPRHAPILPRPASRAAGRVISSKSPRASPLISRGLAPPAGRTPLEGTFAAAQHPARHRIGAADHQPAPHMEGPWLCPESAAVEMWGGWQNRYGWAGRWGSPAGAPGSELERVKHRWDR